MRVWKLRLVSATVMAAMVVSILTVPGHPNGNASAVAAPCQHQGPVLDDTPWD